MKKILIGGFLTLSGATASAILTNSHSVRRNDTSKHLGNASGKIRMHNTGKRHSDSPSLFSCSARHRTADLRKRILSKTFRFRCVKQ